MAISSHDLHTDEPIAPGAVLADELEARGMTQKELALRADRPLQAINEIVQGRKSITADTALELEKVLGISAQVWLNLETLYQMDLAKQREREHLKQWVSRLADFPVADMKKRGLLPDTLDKIALLEHLLRFFGVATLDDAWAEAAVGFRITGRQSSVSGGALAVWLRAGVLGAQKIQAVPYDEAAFKTALRDIRSLTTLPSADFCPRMVELCRQTGVALVFVREYPKSGANGCARWLSRKKALIQLSLRYRRADTFWFSFFHEAKHVLSHKGQVFVDGLDGADVEAEREADEFARDWLIPPDEYTRFVEQNVFTEASITNFARGLGIEPGIVVGRLQHEEVIGYNVMLQLVRRLQWTEPSGETDDDG